MRLWGGERPNRPSEADQAQRVDAHWTGREGSADRDARTPRRCTLSRSPASTHVRTNLGPVPFPRAPPVPRPRLPRPNARLTRSPPGNALRIEGGRQITRADSPGSATRSRGCWHSPAGHTLGVQYNVTSATPGERKTKKNRRSRPQPPPAHGAALQTSITLRYGGCLTHRRLPRCSLGV